MPDTPEAETEMVAKEVPEPPVTGFVPKATDTPVGAEAVNITLSEKPVMAVIVMVDESELPGAIVMDEGAAAMVKSGFDTITVTVSEWLIGMVTPTAFTLTL